MKIILLITQLILFSLECWFYFKCDDFQAGILCNILIVLIAIINILI